MKSALHKRISQHFFLFVSFLLFGGDKGAVLLTWKVLCRTWQFVETVRWTIHWANLAEVRVWRQMSLEVAWEPTLLIPNTHSPPYLLLKACIKLSIGRGVGISPILSRSERKKMTTADECVTYETVIKKIRKVTSIKSNLNEVGQF